MECRAGHRDRPERDLSDIHSERGAVGGACDQKPAVEAVARSEWGAEIIGHESPPAGGGLVNFEDRGPGDVPALKARTAALRHSDYQALDLAGVESPRDPPFAISMAAR